MLIFQSSLLFLIDCGIRTKQEMELLPCDLTSCYLCQLFTDLRRSKTYFTIILLSFILFFIIYYFIYFFYFLLINLLFKYLTCWLVSNQLIKFLNYLNMFEIPLAGIKSQFVHCGCTVSTPL